MEEYRCPNCSGPMWDNRAENIQRRIDGLKARPDFVCKDKGKCDGVIWKAGGENVGAQVESPAAGLAEQARYKAAATPSFHSKPSFDSDGMLKCNAMNNAIAYINNREALTIKDLENIYNEILEVLRK